MGTGRLRTGMVAPRGEIPFPTVKLVRGSRSAGRAAMCPVTERPARERVPALVLLAPLVIGPVVLAQELGRQAAGPARAPGLVAAEQIASEAGISPEAAEARVPLGAVLVDSTVRVPGPPAAAVPPVWDPGAVEEVCVAVEVVAVEDGDAECTTRQ
jgi:hypothetical protein